MSKYKNFNDFELAVIETAKKRSSETKGAVGMVLGGVVLGSLAGAILGGPMATFSTIGLNEFLFKTYLKETYEKRFNSHKENSQYIDEMVEKAADDIMKKNI